MEPCLQLRVCARRPGSTRLGRGVWGGSRERMTAKTTFLKVAIAALAGMLMGGVFAWASGQMAAA